VKQESRAVCLDAKRNLTTMVSETDALRIWVLITGLAGLGASIGAYTKPLSPHKTLYQGSTATACAEFARMYGTWLLTSTCVRVAFFADPTNPTLFWVAFCTYCVALVHFSLEIFIFKAAALKPGGIAPLVVASSSIVWFLLHASGFFDKR
jgi:Erg28 like protein